MESVLQQRLRLIDFYLMFYGKVNRSDLMRHSDVSIATASRTFNTYRKEHGENLTFDVSQRTYLRSPQFNAAYQHEPTTALKLIAWGYEEKSIASKVYGIPPSDLTASNLDANIVATITRAIIGKHNIEIKYTSYSGTKTRSISPHSLFFGLGAWHMRACEKKENQYQGRSFRLNRVHHACEVPDATFITKDEDSEWLEPVVLSLAPHCKHQDPTSLAFELGLEDRPVLNVYTNAAMAGYVLNDLRVDCSKGAILPPRAFNLQLMNKYDVRNIESVQTLGPGY